MLPAASAHSCSRLGYHGSSDDRLVRQPWHQHLKTCSQATCCEPLSSQPFKKLSKITLCGMVLLRCTVLHTTKHCLLLQLRAGEHQLLLLQAAGPSTPTAHVSCCFHALTLAPVVTVVTPQD